MEPWNPQAQQKDGKLLLESWLEFTRANPTDIVNSEKLSALSLAIIQFDQLVQYFARFFCLLLKVLKKNGPEMRCWNIPRKRNETFTFVKNGSPQKWIRCVCVFLCLVIPVLCSALGHIQTAAFINILTQVEMLYSFTAIILRHFPVIVVYGFKPRFILCAPFFYFYLFSHFHISSCSSSIRLCYRYLRFDRFFFIDAIPLYSLQSFLLTDFHVPTTDTISD